MVGELIGSGEAQERGIVGETPNIAARLQGVAEPNTVVIAESTRKLLGNLFELENLGPRDIKGITEPVRAWAALRPSSVEGRFEGLHAAASLRSSGGKKNSNCSCGAGQGKDRRRSDSVALRRGGHRQIAAHGCILEKLTAFRTRAYATSVHRSTPTARSIRSSPRWNVLLG